jgi:hypothetical protein
MSEILTQGEASIKDRRWEQRQETGEKNNQHENKVKEGRLGPNSCMDMRAAG